MTRPTAVAMVLALCGAAFAQQAPKVYRADHAEVRYSGISEAYAAALGRTASAAHACAVEMGYVMPDKFIINVSVGNTGLFTDGTGYMNLTVRNERAMRKPSESGVFHIYGICHEIGHMITYGAMPTQIWMDGDAGQAWAHFIGSRLVDAVYAREGAGLWPDRYDYRADGMARFERGLKSGGGAVDARTSALWKEFVAIVGDKGAADVFAAWGRTEVDPADPGAALSKALFAVNADPRLPGWWKKMEPLLVDRQEKSAVVESTAAAGDLSGEPVELKYDDGVSVSTQSYGQGAHAVRFRAPAGEHYLTAVKLFGFRYGTPQPPAEDFRVWLCDQRYRVIAQFNFPYSSFERGDGKWVTLDTKPTKVPLNFYIVFAFNPTQTKGVSVSHDAASSGNSFHGLPGKSRAAFTRGDWLIRAILTPAGKK